jgi:tRNA A-37 threonylcarbamoyl transferase component Bud32
MTGVKPQDIVLIRKKKKKNIISEIYRYNNTLVKRFIKTALFPDTRAVWRIEDTALRRLSGLNVPKTYGFSQKKVNGALEIMYVREFIDGAAIDKFEISDMAPLARMIAQIHARGVVTRDPSLENFIRTPDGKIVFIDFGRSAIFNPKNPVLIDYQAKELARVRCHAFVGDDVLYDLFHDLYFVFFPCGKVRRRLMEFIADRWFLRFERKHLCQKRK